MASPSALLDFIANKVLLRLALVLLALEVYNYIFHGGVPNLRTAPAIRKRIIDILRKDCAARGKSPYVIVDLGSGNGLFTREIARALPEARVIGLDIARMSLWWSNFMKCRLRLTNLEYRHMNILDYDFTEADAAVTFLIPELTWPLGKKIREKAHPGTLAISNKFILGKDWQPVEDIQVKTRAIHQGRFFVYRV